MKKFFYSVVAASMLFATSCSHEDIVDITKGEGQKVTFKVNLPEQAASRAAGDGTKADNLIFAMYENGTTEDAKEALISKLIKDSDDGDDDGQFTVTVPMAKDITYDLLFFAYNEEHCAFKLHKTTPSKTDLRALQFKEKLDGNEDAYDAFVKVCTNVGINEKNEPIELIRPFAQVNAATSSKDWNDAAETLKSPIANSVLTIQGVPSTYNVFEETATGSMTVSFSPAAPLDETLEGYTDHKYLTLAYVLAGDNASQSTATANFIFYREGDNKQVSSLARPNFPLQRNHRTNVVGKLLTEMEQYIVKIDPNIGTLNVVNPQGAASVKDVQTPEQWAEVAALLNTSTEETISIKLGGIDGRSADDKIIPVHNPAIINANKTVILDLNGYTLSQHKECTESYSMIENNGKLTIIDSSEGKNGKISFKDTGAGDSSFGWGSYTINNHGELVVEDGTIEHLGEQAFATHMICAIFQYSGSTTINGGTISTPAYRSVRLWHGDMTIYDGTFDGQLWVQAVDNSAALTINGGSFSPNGNDGSSVFVENKTYNVTFSVTGGTFNTKIGCSNATKLAGSIIGGTFTDAAKENTNEALLAEGFSFEQNSDGKWAVNSVLVQVGEKAYEIHNLAGLKAFRNAVNNGNTFEGYTITLKEDIDLNNEQWIPIGYWETFDGTFDGDNHTISNLKHHATELDCYIGLFGCTKNATIKNLIIENADIKLIGDNEWAGGHIGALVGQPNGRTTIENINLTGLVKIEGEAEKLGAQRIGAVVGGFTATSLTMKDVTVNVSEDSYVKGNLYIGGVAGAPLCKTTMTNVTSNIDVYSQDGIVGGIIGYAGPNSEFTNCSSSGSVTRIETASDATENQYMRIGGIIGSWEGSSGTVTLTNCEYTGTLSAKDNSGTSITEFENSNLAGKEYFENNPNPTGKLIIDGQTVAYAGYKVIADGVSEKFDNKLYQISNANGLFWFANEVNVNENSFADKTVQLTADIDLNNEVWTPIGQTGATQFQGTFDGNDKTISNLSINKISETGEHYSSGLFGWLNAATVKKVNVITAVVKGNHNVGVIAGYLETSGCTVENCHVTGATVECHVANEDANGDKAGVIVGHAGNAGVLVKKCTAKDSTVSAGRDAGQIVGAAKEANVTECAAENVTVTANGEGTGANINNSIIGRILQ